MAEEQIAMLEAGKQVINETGYNKCAYFSTPYSDNVLLVYSLFVPESGQFGVGECPNYAESKEYV